MPSTSLSMNINDHKPPKTLKYTPSAKEWQNSTTRKSRKIGALERLKAFDIDASTNMSDLIGALNEIQAQLVATTSIDNLFGVIVGVVSEVIEFDRVMLYRFDECKCGAVVSEYVNPASSKDLFIGLHFPSSDLPPHTRALYKLDPVQIMRNRTAKPATLKYRGNCQILDLTQACLRDVAPERVDFFSDLDVRSAMSISLIVEGDLWGLIKCHTYGTKVVEVSPLKREMCRNIGLCASNQIERLLNAEKLEARIMLATGLQRKTPSAFITATASSILDMFTAEFGILVLNDEARAIGKLVSYHEALALVHYFRSQGVRSIIASQKITADFPDLKYSFCHIAGLLVIPLSGSGVDFMIVFRKQQLMEIHWAGNSEERFELVGGGNSEPKAGFQRWVEHVTNTSREWTSWQLEMAGILSTLYGTFTEIWQKNQANIEKSRMKQLLISNASHEVRTPLNHIINNLEIAVESNASLDPTTYEHVEASLRASKSLLYVINDLLHLTKLEHSDLLLQDEPFSLRGVIHEVVDAFQAEAERKGLHMALVFNVTHLPAIIRGDPQRLRQIVSNILSNSLENSHHGMILVSVRVAKGREPRKKDVLVITIKDEGEGMTEAQLDTLFQQFEDILDEDDAANTPGAALGLGLAVAARFVRNSLGQMKMRTKKHVGTEVILELPLKAGTEPKHPLPTPPHDILVATPMTPQTPFPTRIHNPPRYVEKEIQVNISSSPLQSPDLGPDLAYVSDQFASTSSLPSSPPIQNNAFPFPTVATPPSMETKLQILIAEDNPLNAKVLRVMLIKMGHEVVVVGDGQACFDTFKENPAQFNVILMDFQMPLLDGPTSTKAIRSLEASSPPVSSALAITHDRIPIIAVSASLTEDKLPEYRRDGFDGWILKPIDMKRLGVLLSGIWDNERRNECSYTENISEWERGGWFEAGKGE